MDLDSDKKFIINNAFINRQTTFIYHIFLFINPTQLESIILKTNNYIFLKHSLNYYLLKNYQNLN